MKTATKAVEDAKLPTLLEAANRLRNFTSRFTKLSPKKRAAFVERAKATPEVSGQGTEGD